MRGLLGLVLLAVPLLAGCTAAERHEDNSCVNGVCQDRSFECVNGECEVCVDGACADCERDECKTCFDGGACPESLDTPQGQGPGNATPLPDVSIVQAVDLSLGLPETSWEFDVAAGATGTLRFSLRDLATRSAVVNGGACLHYSVSGPGVANSGSSGSCGNVGPIAVTGGTVNSDPAVIHERTPQTVGHYTYSVSASAQPNELVVELVVDNPPLSAAA